MATFALAVSSKYKAPDAPAPVTARQDSASAHRGGIMALIQDQLTIAEQERIKEYPLVFMESSDGLKLAHQLFRPVTFTHGTSILVFLAPVHFCTLLARLSQEHGVVGVRFDPRSSGESDGRPGHVGSRKELFGDVHRIIGQCRLSFPSYPVFVGGIAGGAAMVINYCLQSTSFGYSTPNGLFLIDPLLNPSSSMATNYCKEVFSTQPLSFLRRMLGSKRKIELEGQLADFLKTKKFNSEYFKGTTLEDPIGQIERLLLSNGYSVFLQLSAKFPMADNQVLYARLSPLFSGTANSRIVSVDEGLVETLRAALEQGGPWMTRLAATMSPFSACTSKEQWISNRSQLDFLQIVGKGSFGTVWLASCRNANKYVAVKMLSKGMLLQRDMVAAAARELQVLKECLTCPWTAQLSGCFQDGRAVYICMDYLIGGELLTLLCRRGRLPWDPDARFYFAELCLALSWLHSRGIVYRDLKPENILLDGSGHLRLVDFGFSQIVGVNGRSTAFCGSPFYVAPEMLQRRRAGHGAEVDWWSAGVVLFEMVCGRPPFSGDTANKVYRKILFFEGGRSAVKKLANDTAASSDVIELLAMLLQPQPEDRAGWDEVKKSAAMRGVDWEAIQGRVLPPPHVPIVSSMRDTANFPKTVATTSFEEYYETLELIGREEESYFIGVLDS